MKHICKHINLYHIMIISFGIIFFVGICCGSAAAYYTPPIPTWGRNLSFGWGGYPAYGNFTGYETYSNPYMYGPFIGAYPYNAGFDIYSGAYTMNLGYNQQNMGYYNTGNYSGYGRQDINAYGYPLPYAFTDQRAWGNQMNYASGIWGFPPATGTYMSSGNPMNIYYNPAAFTIDLGIDAYQTGISNFWKDLFERLDEEEEEEE